MSEILVGDIVVVEHSFSGCNKGELAFVYETYADFDDNSKFGVSIITRSGRDLGGFSNKEQLQYLKKSYSSGVNYQFENIMKLYRDFKSGMFSDAFNLANA